MHSQTLFDASRGADAAALGADAERAFSKAAEVLGESGNQAELAKVLRTYGTVLVEHGDVAGGRARLQDAAALFRKLGLAQALEKTERTLASLS